MAAFKLKLAIDQGATYRKRVIWNVGPKKNPVPVDLTGATARAQIRTELAAPTVLHELTTENGGIALNAVPGGVDLFISAVDTAAFTWEAAVYDLEIVLSNGDVRRLLAGPVTVSREVTR